MRAPELRFSEFSGEWAEKKGSQLFESSRAKGEEGLPIYSVTLNNGLVPRDSLDRRMENDAANEDNLRAQSGDLVYNMMRMWQGAVGLAETECMVSPAYIVLSGKKETDTKFFDYNFKRSRPLYDLWAYSYGLTNDRLRLYFKDFGQIKFWVPSKKNEQQKIAAFLGSVDDKLNKLRRKRELLKTWKRGLMKKIFSQQLHFTQDDGGVFPDWEEKKIGAIYDWIKTNSLSREMLMARGGEVHNIHYGDIHIKYSVQFDQRTAGAPYIKDPGAGDVISEIEYCKMGDVVIADASEDYKDIGKAIEIVNVKPRSLVAGLHTYIARPKGDFVSGFSGYLFQSEKLRKKIKRIAQGISVLGISKTNLEKLYVPQPSLAEQQKIANFFSSADKKIETVTRQIEQTETFKKGLLQKMFV